MTDKRMTNAPPSPIPRDLLERLAALPSKRRTPILGALAELIGVAEAHERRPARTQIKAPIRAFGWLGRVETPERNDAA